MSEVRLIPLGGLGEVGMNCMALETANDLILIDCGSLANHNPWLGFDHIIPNFSYLKDKQHKFRGIVLTHGHEDHIGALSIFLENFSVPKISLSILTMELLSLRLKNQFLKNIEFQIVEPMDKVDFGDFKVQYLPNTHSFLESFFLNIESPVGNIVHTGDYKVDHQPYMPWRFYVEEAKKLAPCRLLLADSTNSEKKGRGITDSEIYPFIKAQVVKAKGKVLVTTFSSNTQRIQMLIDIAKETGRKIFLHGNSMHKFMDMNIRLGNAKIAENLMQPVEKLSDYKENEILIVTTGSQGEYTAGLARVSRGEDPHVKLKSGDVVLFSALKIPGNEINIRYLINSLTRMGAQVVHSTEERIHSSGHAYQEEQKEVIEWFQPENFLPVHGDYSMLQTHAATALATQIPKKALVIENGEILVLTENDFYHSGESVDATKYWVRSGQTGRMDEPIFREKKRLARDGLVILQIYVDQHRLLSTPKIFCEAMMLDSEKLNLYQKEVIRSLEKYFAALPNDIQVPVEKLREDTKAIVSRLGKKLCSIRPHISIIWNE